MSARARLAATQRIVAILKAIADVRYGEVHVDLERSTAVYQEWKALARSARDVSPDGTRRPLWLKRPQKPVKSAYLLPVAK